MEGYRMVVRCIKGDMEWLLGVQRVHGGCTEGTQRACRGSQMACEGV